VVYSHRPVAQVETCGWPGGAPLPPSIHPARSLRLPIDFIVAEGRSGQDTLARRAAPHGIHRLEWHIFKREEYAAVLAQTKAVDRNTSRGNLHISPLAFVAP